MNNLINLRKINVFEIRNNTIHSITQLLIISTINIWEYKCFHSLKSKKAEWKLTDFIGPRRRNFENKPTENDINKKLDKKTMYYIYLGQPHNILLKFTTENFSLNSQICSTVAQPHRKKLINITKYR